MLTITPKFLYELLNNNWKKELKDEFSKNYFKKIANSINQTQNKRLLCPKIDNIFYAYELSLEEIKVVILGQDPYHGENQANGLSFAVDNKVKKPPSLKNIFKEIEDDLNIKLRTSSDLKSLSKQGVFLLNSTLTVERKKPNSHSNTGWSIFTDKTIELISKKRNNIVFILWGKNAIKKEILIDQKKHLILKSSHPSPLSAYRGFFGSKHFSKTNKFLEENDIKSINWTI